MAIGIDNAKGTRVEEDDQQRDRPLVAPAKAGSNRAMIWLSKLCVICDAFPNAVNWLSKTHPCRYETASERGCRFETPPGCPMRRSAAQDLRQERRALLNCRANGRNDRMSREARALESGWLVGAEVSRNDVCRDTDFVTAHGQRLAEQQRHGLTNRRGIGAPAGDVDITAAVVDHGLRRG